MLWQIIFFLCILWYLLELWKIRRVVAASRQIKSSFISLPLIGHSYMFIGSNEDRMTAIKKVSYDAMKNATNVSNMRLAFEFFTVVVDAEAIDILSKEFLSKPPMLYRFSRKLLGDGSLMAPLNIWRPRRKLLAPMFGQKNLLNFVKEFSKQSMILAQNLQSVAGGEAFSVWPFFTTYTLDTVCETALGIQLDKQIQKHEEFRKAFEEYTVIGSRRIFNPWLYPGAIYRLHPDCKKLKKYGATVNKFITDVFKYKAGLKRHMQYVHEKVRPPRNKICDQCVRGFTTNYNILEMLLQTADDTSTRMLIEEMLVLVLAATDTSAVGASFTAVMLSKYPEVQKKVYEEIRTVIGEKNRPIEVSDLAHLKYLEAVIKETLRLYPPVPVVARAVHKDITLPSGVTLVKGSNLLLSAWGAHRHPQYWGEDAEEFNPGRFITGSYTQSAFIPFSCGPRGCLGYKYAMMSLKTMIATLVMHYEILQAPNLYSGPIRLQYNIMMKDVDNFQIKLKLR